MANLIAYIPVLNQRHIDWFRRHPGSQLFLISQEMAEQLLPRLARNMAAIPTELMVEMIQSTRLVKEVYILNNHLPFGEVILADEDISHALVNTLSGIEFNVFTFEMIWARWDMGAVHKAQPVIADVTVSMSILDRMRMDIAKVRSVRSPDWWRQIGAAAFQDDACIAVACNTHMPNEYETYIFGDPRLNVDAGQVSKYCALHAERAIIAECARKGAALQGASLYITTFPCEDCAREVAYAGVKRVFFRDGYSVLNAQEVLRSEEVQIIQIVESPGSA